jgi:hypothetical protein
MGVTISPSGSGWRVVDPSFRRVVLSTYWGETHECAKVGRPSSTFDDHLTPLIDETHYLVGSQRIGYTKLEGFGFRVIVRRCDLG